MNPKKVVIIGAGPAGLAAAYRLVQTGSFKVTILEKDNQVGGLARTIHHGGNLFDIGPHRFFSQSKRVNDFWLSAIKNRADFLTIPRLTRMYYLKKLIPYPVKLNCPTLIALGQRRTLKIFFSYLKIRFRPIRPENSLADFFSNRFGSYLYQTFFKGYTKKVWGVDAENIPPDWGAQRVKSLSLLAVIRDFLMPLKHSGKKPTSLIDSFNYPKYGSGQIYENLADKIQSLGGEIRLNCELEAINFDANGLIESVSYNNRIWSIGQ